MRVLANFHRANFLEFEAETLQAPLSRFGLRLDPIANQYETMPPQHYRKRIVQLCQIRAGCLNRTKTHLDNVFQCNGDCFNNVMRNYK